MNRLIYKYISIILAIYLAALLSGTVHVRSLAAVLMMGVVLLIVNLLLRPFLLLITLPLNILTLGLFGFVINALTIMIADALVSGVSMGGFINSLLTSLLIVVVYHILLEHGESSRRNRRE